MTWITWQTALLALFTLAMVFLGWVMKRAVRELLELKHVTRRIDKAVGGKNPPSGVIARVQGLETRLDLLQRDYNVLQRELGRLRGHMRAGDLIPDDELLDPLPKPVVTKEVIEELRKTFEQELSKSEHTKDEPMTNNSKGFTLIELLIVVAIIGIIAAITIPGLLRARMAGNESSAIGSLRAVISGQSIYSSTCGNGGYAVDLADLAKPSPGGRDGFVGPDINVNGVVKSGYVITLAADASPGAAQTTDAANTCNGSTNAPMSSYFASAVPVTPGTTGTRHFATDSRATIYFDMAAPVPNPIPATAISLQ